MNINPEDTSFHRQLLELFDEYARLSIKWEKNKFFNTGKSIKKNLRKLMFIAYLQWQDIQFQIKEKKSNKVKHPLNKYKYKNLKLSSLSNKKKCLIKKQNSKVTQDDDTNT